MVIESKQKYEYSEQILSFSTEFLNRRYKVLNFSFENRNYMTELGLFLQKKSVSKAEVAKKTGISKSRISELTLNDSTHLRAKELYLIALAIDTDPCELLKTIFKDTKLKK